MSDLDEIEYKVAQGEMSAAQVFTQMKRQVQSLQQQLEWKSIETAPKGGGANRVSSPDWVEPPKILLLFEQGDTSVGYWDWYYAESGRGFNNISPWVEPCSGDQLSLHYDDPIGWMPIPSQPEKQGE